MNEVSTELIKQDRGILLEPPVDSFLDTLDSKHKELYDEEPLLNMMQISVLLDEVKEVANENLYDGMFKHMIDNRFNALDEVLRWEYEIKVKNCMFSFEVFSEKVKALDVAYYHNEIAEVGEVHYRAFRNYFEEKLYSMGSDIREFNEFLLLMPTFPTKFPADDIIENIMHYAEPRIDEYYPDGGFDHTISTIPSWFKAIAYDELEYFYLNDFARIHFDVFAEPDFGWGEVKLKLEIKEVPVSFTLSKYELSLYDMLDPAMKLVSQARSDIINMESSVRNWNRFITQKENKKKKRRYTFGRKRRK